MTFGPINLEKNDYPIFLSIMAEKKQKRHDLMVLFSFFETLFSVRTKVSEPALGVLRIRWWHDALQSGVQEPLILVHMRDLANRHDIPLETFTLLCEALEKDLSTNTFNLTQTYHTIFKPFMSLVFQVLDVPVYHKRYYINLYMYYKLKTTPHLNRKVTIKPQKRLTPLHKGKKSCRFLFMMCALLPKAFETKKAPIPFIALKAYIRLFFGRK